MEQQPEVWNLTAAYLEKGMVVRRIASSRWWRDWQEVTAVEKVAPSQYRVTRVDGSTRTVRATSRFEAKSGTSKSTMERTA
ncbi:hypothetical protein [Amycolatopsis thermoflava]|uniref:hypothetical protein n=1 Tax=Amycolatopsis thermoflava TaxID=84480 RepID=UPI003F4A7D84